MSVLEVTGLETQFRSSEGLVKAVGGISFAVDRGETLGIVGESGSGKSVTSLSIMRLVPNPPGLIAAGRIMFDGKDLRSATDREIRAIRGNRIAMIFQDPMTSLNPVMRVGQQITESLRLHKRMSKRIARARAIELFDLVGIPDSTSRIDDYPHQFSGGMRQRVMIAMALACDPELLIADEPTTALDVTIQAQILELIRGLQKRLGMAVILITHDMGVVAGVADRVAVMYAGRIVEEGVTATIFADPRMPYTIGLLRSIPRLDEEDGRRLTPIPGFPPNLADPLPGCPFAPRCAYFVAGICDKTVPQLRHVAPGHRAACHFDVTLKTPLPATIMEVPA